MAKAKYYVVWTGKTPGIYTNWSDCKEQIHHFPGAKYKSYDTEYEAKTAYMDNVADNVADNVGYETDSISVDVGCSGNPGIVEYRGVDTFSGDVVFAVGPIAKGTNNLGEFLAIVHALALLKKRNSRQMVYSDSRTAIKWVKEKQVASTLVRDESTSEIWQMTDRAVKWLKSNTYENKVCKWDTENWGQIKADYGRK